MLFPPHVLAAASIYLTTILLDSCPPLPLEPKPWWDLFDVTRRDLRIVSSHILRLYDAVPPAHHRLYELKEEELLGIGIAARVHQKHGGLSELVEKSSVREWLRLNVES